MQSPYQDKKDQFFKKIKILFNSSLFLVVLQSRSIGGDMKIIFFILLIQLGFAQESYEDFPEDEEEFYQGEDINYDAFNESDLEILLENNESIQQDQMPSEDSEYVDDNNDEHL